MSHLSARPPPDFSANLEVGVNGMRLAWSSNLGYAAVDPDVIDITKSAAMAFSAMGANVEDA